MALSSNNKIAKKKPIGLGLCAFMVTFLTNLVSLSIQYPSPGFGVHVALWVCTHYPSTGFGVHVTLWVCLYTLPLPWVWCSFCSVSLSVHTTPPLWICLYTIPLPWVWYSCCSVFWFLCNVLLTIVCLFDFLMPKRDIAIPLSPSL
jgi:hypothetical protein